MAEEAKRLRVRAAEFGEAWKMKPLKVQAMHRTEDMELVAEQESVECAEQTTRTSQLEGDLHALKCRSDFFKPRNNVMYTRYSVLSGKCDLLNR